MVHTASEGLHDTLHLELEQEGCELSDRNAGLHADDIQLQIIGLLKEANNLSFWFREVRETTPFDAVGKGLLQTSLILPAHRPHKIIGTGDEGCSIVTNKVIATFGIFGTHMTWESKHTPIVTLGYLCRDESPTFGGTLNDDSGTIRLRRTKLGLSAFVCVMNSVSKPP